MIDETELVKGKYYFLLSFYHSKTKALETETLIYLGKNILRGKDEPTENEWIFLDPYIYLKYGDSIYDRVKKDEYFIANKENFSHMYDLDGLIEFLKRVRDDRV